MHGLGYRFRGGWSIPLLVLLLAVPTGILWAQEDLERAFFQDVAEMERDYRDFEESAFESFRREVEALWQDFVTSTRKDWVEYSGDKTGRSRVDFETGEVLVEVLVPKNQAERDKAAVRERLSTEIERLVEDRGKTRDYPVPVPPPPGPLPPGAPPEKEIPPAPLLPQPVLEGQLQTRSGTPVTGQNKEAFAREVVETRPVSKVVVRTPKGEMIKAQVRFSLVPDHLRIRGEKYLESVRRHAGRFHIAVPLAFAVIHTESYFNPKATSPAPAYGLMQLVPRSGARDAYRFVYGTDRVLPADYLYVPEHNIELGCAYLGLLQNHYFKGVEDPQSALFCAVASYNTGAGNLSRALVGRPSLRDAVGRINEMDPQELFAYLQGHLPYAETRDYIQKVRDRMNLYKAWE